MSRENVLIGMVGQGGSGKDTIAEILHSLNPNLVVDSFARPIRAVAHHFGFDIFDRAAKEITVTRQVSVPDLAFQLEVESGLCLEGFTALKVATNFMKAALDQGLTTVQGNTVQLTMSPRLFAQLLGTEGGRSVDPDIWTALLVDRAFKRYHEGGIRTIVTDVRFFNEAVLMDALVHVRRPDNPHKTVTSSHTSEAFATLVDEGKAGPVVARRIRASIINDFKSVELLRQFVQFNPGLQSL